MSTLIEQDRQDNIKVMRLNKLGLLLYILVCIFMLLIFICMFTFIWQGVHKTLHKNDNLDVQAINRHYQNTYEPLKSSGFCVG